MSVFSDNRILVYVDVDENGNITDAEIGRRIIPSKQYDHFFVSDDENVLVHPEKFKVQDDRLVENIK